MGDPSSEIRHLLARYEEAQIARDLSVLADLHWQDDRFTHVWSPGRTSHGWQVYEATLREELDRMEDVAFRLIDVRIEVFGGRFAVAQGGWACEWAGRAGEREALAGQVTFVICRMGGSWKIVSDHYSVSRAT